MKIETLNIKSDYPPADLAVANFEIAIEGFDKSDTLLVKVIHGYGSHGKGGEIKRQLLLKLSVLKKLHKILEFIPGEHFGESVKNSDFILQKFPELLIDTDLKNYNSGITLVFLNEKK